MRGKFASAILFQPNQGFLSISPTLLFQPDTFTHFTFPPVMNFRYVTLMAACVALLCGPVAYAQFELKGGATNLLTIRGNADISKRLLLGYDTTASKVSLQSYTAAATTGQILLNPSGGNVGINKIAPAVALDVAGSIAASGSISATGTITAAQYSTPWRMMTKSVEYWGDLQIFGALFQFGLGQYPANTSATVGEMVLLGSPRLHLATANGGAAVTTLSARNVGIGTTNPTQARLQVEGFNRDFGFIGGTKTSIYASDSIWGNGGFYTSSDKRIKNISGVSDGASDLRTLMGVEVTNYSYKDVISKGKAEQKKVVAQQVETVFPQAVSKQTDVVADIYQKAPIDKGWLQLATDLKKGERVKLIGDNEQGTSEVLEVGAGKFRTQFSPDDDEVFVYGREVNDFRTVDYEAIAMLNVSATQQLARELKLLKDENATLRRRSQFRRRMPPNNLNFVSQPVIQQPTAMPIFRKAR